MATTPLSSDRLIVLRGGHVIRVSVFDWLLDRCWRFTFEATPDGHLAVRPRSGLTAADEEFIRQNRTELLAAVQYDADAAGRPA